MPRPLPPAESLNLVPLADIARGGMGSVQLCRVEGGRLGGRVLAVKRLNPELEQDPQFVNMFIDEAWMTAAIASPNVISVVAWGQDALGHYLAVELVQGVSLSRLVKESRAKKEPFSERTVACILSQIGSGLEIAHNLKDDAGASMNLVHRDLTPGNILVGFDGVVKIADFGIARANARLTETTAGTMKGKPSYMAPEQARGTPVDARADLFSFGVMAYELLAGTRPWVGGNDLEILVAVNTQEPKDLSQIRQVDPVFLEITRGCLQKEKEQRFSSAGEVLRKIDAWRRARGYQADDLESLGGFVRRNTQKQLEWFQRALAGAQRDGATFKDVEEQIDKARKPSRSEDPRLTASPQPQPIARPQGQLPHQRQVHAPPVAVPTQQGTMALPVVSAPPQFPAGTSDDLAATRLHQPMQVDVDDLAKTRPIESREARKALVMSLGGTVSYSAEEMAALSRRGPGPPTATRAPPSAPTSSGRGVEGLSPPPPRPVSGARPISGSGWPAQAAPLPPSAAPHSANDPSSPRQPALTGPPVSAGSRHVAPGQAFPHPAAQQTALPQPQQAPPSQQIPPAPSSGPGLAHPPHGFAAAQNAAGPNSAPIVARKGGGGRVILVILFFLLVAGAAAAYFMRARLGI